MDHLPYPQDSPLPPVSVPYHDKFRFDGESFADFPQRCGFDKSRFLEGNFSSIPWDDQTAFLQAWLFFGLLHVCLHAPAEDFIDREDGKITTKKLPHWGQKWRKGLPYFSRTKRLAEYARVQTALREACATLSTMDHVASGKRIPNNLSEEVAFSITVLGLTLDQIFTDYDLVTELGGVEEELRQLSRATVSWPTTRFARNRLEAAGWCTSETKRLERYVRDASFSQCLFANETQIKATGIYYCGSMRQYGPPVDHSQCGVTGCAAENVVEETYVTAHADSCSTWQQEVGRRCEHVGPIVAEVAAILDAGELPILELSKAPSNAVVQLKVVPFRSSTPYTALSHVWADGMGNPHSNTLPQCQIQRLYDLLSSLNGQQSQSIRGRLLGNRHKSDAAYIWMDTLLIPLERRLRKKAIARMYDIYKNAKSVLVLDRSLLSVSADSPPEELCFRLSAASWMRRAWTLQEGALATNLYVQFRERAVSPVKLSEQAYQRVWKSEPWNIILEECGMVIRYITQSGDDGGDEQLSHVLAGLSQRSTSHPEDKEICLAVMLKMDMKAVLALEGQQRTLEIVKRMPYVPRPLLWHEQPGLDISGCGWIPQQIIATGGGVRQMGLQLTNTGLVVNTQAMIFRARTHYLDRPVQHIRDVQTGKWYGMPWEGDMAPITKKLLTYRETWTVLAALPNRETMFSSYHVVIIRLDWTLQNASSDELLRHAAGSASVKGEFIGRGHLEALDDATNERMHAKSKSQTASMEDYRRAVRMGESSLDGASEKIRKIYEEEGDDSWYVLDGVMETFPRKWVVA